jgi:hypothetical protein
MMRAITLLAVMGCAMPAFAGEKQYRKITLTDGRVLGGEVVSTEEVGILMRCAQGQVLIPFEELLDMAPTTRREHDLEAPWVVYLQAPENYYGPIAALYQSIPGMRVIELGVADGGLTVSQAEAAKTCDQDLECVSRAIADAPWMWVLHATEDDEGGLTVRSGLNTGGQRKESRAATGDDNALWPVLHTAIGLLEPDGPPPENIVYETNRSAGAFSERRVLAMSFAPVPGLPSLAQRDGGNAGLAWAVVLPSTALWVGAVGHGAQTSPEAVGLSVAGFYVSTVLVNQVFGLRSLKR